VRAATAARNLWLRDADAFVAMSARIRDEIVSAGVPPERVALIPHGVDTSRFRPASPPERAALRSRLGLPPGVLAVWTGRLLRGKGLETLVEALARVADEAPGLQVVLVGSGVGQALSIEEELKSSVAARGLAGRVLFAGRAETVEDYLRAGDLFVFPSLTEGLGISLVEAAACGLPSIGSRTGGIVDVIEDGRTGLLVTSGDVSALADALARLARDAGAREEMGGKARARAATLFDERDAVARYRSVFAEVSSRRASACPPGRAPREGAGPPPSPASRA
jgi:glycosyltransferase involved in cell wall biosynthesis